MVACELLVLSRTSGNVFPQQRIRLRGLQSVSKGAVTKFRVTGYRESKGRVRA